MYNLGKFREENSLLLFMRGRILGMKSLFESFSRTDAEKFIFIEGMDYIAS